MYTAQILDVDTPITIRAQGPCRYRLGAAEDSRDQEATVVTGKSRIYLQI